MALVRQQGASNFSSLRQKPAAVWTIVGGSISGPFLGIWLALISIQRAPLGIASTLQSLSPIFLLPLSYFLFRERIGLASIAGTLVAFAGTALLFLPG